MRDQKRSTPKTPTEPQEQALQALLTEAADLKVMFPNPLQLRLNLKSLLADFLLLNSNEKTQIAEEKDVENYGFTIYIVCKLLQRIEPLA